MRVLIYICLACLSIKSLAQVTKYKDIVPMIEGASDKYTMDVLNAFLIKNLDHPAANLKIASLYLKKALEVDPLIEYEMVQALAERAQQKLFKAGLLITEKEVNKRSEYYAWIAKKNEVTEVTFSLVKQELKSENEEVSKIIKSLPLVYSNFTTSVDFYDKSVKNFNQISSNYLSLKNLYLLYDSKLDEKFTTLKSDYDSSIYYFEAFKVNTDSFKLKGYNQILTISPINVFRYDGLVTQIDFLKNDVDIWNYGAWVDTVRAVVQGDIAELRKLLKTNEDRQNAAISKISSSAGNREAVVVPVDKSLVFNLLRFDYNNPIVPLLKYKESKQKLLIEEKNSLYFDTANIEIERKLLFYNKMVYQILESDSIISQFKNRFDAVRMAKYKLFLDENYKGIDGSSQYMASEKNNLRKELAIYGELLQEGVESIKPIDSIGTTVRYKSLRVPLYIARIDTALLATGVPYTTHILAAPDGGFYVAGEYKPNKKLRNTKVYLLKINSQNKLKWFKNYDIEIDSAGVDSNSKLASITLTNEGVAMLIRSTHLTSQSHANSLVQVLLDGNIKIAKRLGSDLYPRKVLYNEEQNSFVISYNGNNLTLDDSEKNKFELKTINSLGEVSWTYSDANVGSFVGFLRTENGYIIARNSISLGKPKVLLTKVDFAGVKGQEKIINLGVSVPIQRIYKLNDASIHLIGDGLYQMINANLEKVYP
ncbi:MAG: hypothetical protein L3J29_00100 [Cyclobacteriaceae bacterium]|nr:hypothetical protein [Cyclobacteriaceae bacterium]